MILAYVNVAFNLLAGSSLIAGIWLVAALGWTYLAVSARRRAQAIAPHSIVVLEPGEQVIPLPAGWKRIETQRGTRYIQECSHWPRDEVKLKDGAVVAHICRRCGHDWADERWIAMKDVEW